MRICFVSDFFPGCHRISFGAEIACQKFVELCEKNGHETFILTSSVGATSEQIRNNLKMVKTIESFVGKKIGYSAIFALPFDFFSYKESLRYFKKIKPDIINLQNIKRITFAPLVAAKELGIPVVFSIYDNWSLCPNYCLLDKKMNVCSKFNGLHCFNCVSMMKKPLVLLRKNIFNRFLNLVDMFFLLTEGEKRNFIKYGVNQNKLSIVPLPISGMDDVVQDTLTANIEENSILFVGRIDYSKGLHVLVEAMHHVLKKKKNIKLRVIGEIAGSKSYGEQILKMTKEFNLTDNISYLGKLSNQEVKKNIMKSHVVVVPEQWPIAWPIFMTEAMLYGKKVVASNVGDISTFIDDGKTGYLAVRDDPVDFANKICEALDSADPISMAARQRIVNLCGEHQIYDHIISLYKKVIDKRSAA